MAQSHYNQSLWEQQQREWLSEKVVPTAEQWLDEQTAQMFNVKAIHACRFTSI